MILEEINGAVVATIVRETGGVAELAVGDYFSDHERSSLNVTGTGNIVVRVDANCTLEFRGVEIVAEEVLKEVIPAIPEAAPQDQQVVVEDTVAAKEETPIIVNPKASKA